MAVVNITVENDADFYRSFKYETTEGAPIDLTGGTMEMMLRRRAEDATAVLRLATDTGEIAITNAAAGEFTVMITHVQLQEIALGDYAHSNILTQNGIKVKIWSGILTNNAGPTR